MTEEETIKLLRRLSEFRGRHTELITVYIPLGANIHVIAKQLDAEKSTASNIKSKSTRKNVTDALDKITRELKNYQKTPENGLVIFCGNMSHKEGQSEIEIFLIEPSVPTNIKIYRCDQVFLTDPIRDLLDKREQYGLLVLDRNEATLGLLDGKTIVVLSHHTSSVPGKIKAGGQSAARFSRLREVASKEFFRRMAEKFIKEFGSEDRELKGILIGGPGPSKEDFLSDVELGPLKQKILAVEDIGYSDEHGLKSLVEKSQDTLVEAEVMKEKNLLKDFFTKLGKTKDMVAYKLDEVKIALSRGAVDKLIISEKFEKDNEKEAEELKKLGEEIGAEIYLVSVDTEEGKSFDRLSGVGALLRYKL